MFNCAPLVIHTLARAPSNTLARWGGLPIFTSRVLCIAVGLIGTYTTKLLCNSIHSEALNMPGQYLHPLASPWLCGQQHTCWGVKTWPSLCLYQPQPLKGGRSGGEGGREGRWMEVLDIINIVSNCGPEKVWVLTTLLIESGTVLCGLCL